MNPTDDWPPLPYARLKPFAAHLPEAFLATLDRDRLLALLLELRQDYGHVCRTRTAYGEKYHELFGRLERIRAALAAADTVSPRPEDR